MCRKVSFRIPVSFLMACLVSQLKLEGCHAFLPPAVARQVKNLSALSALDSEEKSQPIRLRRNGNFKRPGNQQSLEPIPNVPANVKPRHALANFEANRNPWINQQRLQDSIGCEHFGKCSGCSVESRVGQIEMIQSAKLFFSSTAVRRKRLDVMKKILDWSVEETDDGFYKVVVPSNVTKWRTQAKLAVAPKSSAWAKDGCAFGLYARGTHTVMSIPNCAVHHPSINRAVEYLVEATTRVRTSAYSVDSREGDLRYVQLQVERSSGKVSLTLVWNAEFIKETQPALSRLVKELNRAAPPNFWHSIWCHCNDGQGNNIFSRNPRRWHRIEGPEFLREPLAIGEHGWLYFSPLTFRQGNLDGFDVIANDVARAVPGGSKVCELYAGVGVLGLTALAHHADGDSLGWIRCSDENAANPRCFKRSVDSLPPSVTGRNLTRRKPDVEEEMTIAELAERVKAGVLPTKEARRGEKTTYLVASAVHALRAGQALGAQVLIVDPPRKGLDDAVLLELCKPYNQDHPCVETTALINLPDDKVCWTNDVQTLIYVSCGFDALARDTERLLSSQGGWKLESATGYVLFPGSDHVETLCVFQRK